MRRRDGPLYRVALSWKKNSGLFLSVGDGDALVANDALRARHQRLPRPLRRGCRGRASRYARGGHPSRPSDDAGRRRRSAEGTRGETSDLTHRRRGDTPSCVTSVASPPRTTTASWERSADAPSSRRTSCTCGGTGTGPPRARPAELARCACLILAATATGAGSVITESEANFTQLCGAGWMDGRKTSARRERRGTRTQVGLPHLPHVVREHILAGVSRVAMESARASRV